MAETQMCSSTASPTLVSTVWWWKGIWVIGPYGDSTTFQQQTTDGVLVLAAKQQHKTSAASWGENLGSTEQQDMVASLWQKVEVGSERQSEFLVPRHMETGSVTRAAICQQGKMINQPSATQSLSLGQHLDN